MQKTKVTYGRWLGLALSLGLLALLNGSDPAYYNDVWPVWTRSVHHQIRDRCAAAVLLTHPGVHTHANFVVFPTGAVDSLSIDIDRCARFPGRRYRNVHVIGHCRLDTNHGALPFALPWLGAEPAWVQHPGRIEDTDWDGDRWHGMNVVKVKLPSRFVNWLVRQPPQVQQSYQDPRLYSLDMSWDERLGPAPVKPGAPLQ